MYYILNETNQIIAADDNLLNLCGLSHIDELSLKLALGNINFDLSEEKIVITNENSDTTFAMSKTPLSSMLGQLTLVEIQIEKEKTEEEDLSVFTFDDTTEETAPLDLDSDSDLISIQTETLEDDNELFDLVLEEEAEKNIEAIEDSLNLLSEDAKAIDLGLSDQAVSYDNQEILIDIDKVSEQIGVTHEDYDAFLDEYIDTALGLEQDLQSTDSTKRSNAVATLSHLGDVLQLPVIGDLLEKVDTAAANDLKTTVESFYGALSRITTSQTPQEEPELALFDSGVEVEEKVETKPEVTVNEKSFGSISLEGIKPIHFDFQLEEAANDLSLPVELIEEFVHDFIDQGHIETEKMLEAYEKGDLDAIQKIGHLLKGASSNLRINPLSDTLYQIQFCEDPSKLEAYIKEYWGHFLSFEIQINALAK